MGYEAPAVSIINGAPNLEAAKALVDWLISVEGQNKLSELKTYFFPVHPEANTGEVCPLSARSQRWSMMPSGLASKESTWSTSGSTRFCAASKVLGACGPLSSRL